MHKLMASCSFALCLGLTVSGFAHEGHDHAADANAPEPTGFRQDISGAKFHAAGDAGVERALVQTVADAFDFMMKHRLDYPNFDETVDKDLLSAVVIESQVKNRDGKEFPILVARTKTAGKVKLLVSAGFLKNEGYANNPQKLVPVLAKEFQWVVSKADTAPKPKAMTGGRDLPKAPILEDREVLKMPAEKRLLALEQLFGTYLLTTDGSNSLAGQKYYEVGSLTLLDPTTADSTTKMYEIRVRQALQKIVSEPYFEKRTPRAVKSLLNGKVWNVAFVRVDKREWATRTRVLPAEDAKTVGVNGVSIQPANVLVNIHRAAASDDPFHADTNGLPMGALSADQLALVIAKEIEVNIVEKGMDGHTRTDAESAPGR